MSQQDADSMALFRAQSKKERKKQLGKEHAETKAMANEDTHSQRVREMSSSSGVANPERPRPLRHAGCLKRPRSPESPGRGSVRFASSVKDGDGMWLGDWWTGSVFQFRSRSTGALYYYDSKNGTSSWQCAGRLARSANAGSPLCDFALRIAERNAKKGVAAPRTPQ